MNCKSSLHLVVVALCSTIALLSGEKPAHADGPDRVSITFALRFEATGFEIDLADFLSEDTIALVIGGESAFGDTTSFHLFSPPCDGLLVGGTDWDHHASLMVLNAGGPVTGRAYVLSGAPAPPTRSVVLLEDVTAVHGCWLDFDGTKFWAQDEIGGADAAFFIITAEFRVTN